MEYEKLLDNLYASIPKKASPNPTGERFEVPTADSFVEGNKTMVKNFDAVVQKLRRKPQEVAKFLAKELAVPCIPQTPQLVLQGRMSARTINEKVALYVQTHVICPQCKKPDTRIEERSRHAKTLVCEACGARTAVRD